MCAKLATCITPRVTERDWSLYNAGGVVEHCYGYGFTVPIGESDILEKINLLVAITLRGSLGGLNNRWSTQLKKWIVV